MTDKSIRKKYYREYIVTYLILVTLFYGAFWLNGKTFIWSADGWTQHIRAMVYYAKWLRLAFRTILVEHSWQVPLYSFSIGYGADILTTFQYYGFGDPITSLCVFVPVGCMQYFYAFCIYARLFFAGLFFSWFCFEIKNIENTKYVLGATLVYIFSGYSMSSVCHPFFLVALLWTPLILTGVERIWRNKGIGLYTIGVCLAAISNFFYFYTIVVFTILYAVLKLVTDEDTIDRRIRKTWRCLYGGVLGAGIVAVILVPTLWTAMHDARTDVNSIHLFNSLQYYRCIPDNFVSFSDGKSLLGYGGVALVAIGIFAGKKCADKRWKYMSIFLLACMLFPILGKICDPSGGGRWAWYWNIVAATAVLEFCDAIPTLDDKVKKRFYIVPTIWVLLSLAFGVLTISGLVQIILAFGLIIMLLLNHKHHDWIILTFVCGSILLNVKYAVGFADGDFTKDFIDNKPNLMEELTWNETARLAEQISDGGFYRVTGESQERNDGLLTGMPSIRYYWSLSNPNVAEFMKQLCVESGISINEISSLDHRLALEALASVQYEMNGEKRENALPLAYMQKKYLNEDEIASFSSLQKQQAMLDAAIVNGSETPDNTETASFESLVNEYIPEIESLSDGIEIIGNRIIVFKENAEITMKTIQLCDGELYFAVNNLSFEEYSELDYYREHGLLSKMNSYERRKLQYEERNSTPAIGTSIVVDVDSDRQQFTKTIGVFNENYRYYFGKKDFLSYLGDVEDGEVTAKIAFPTRGVYTLEKVSFQTLSKKYQIGRIQELAQNAIEDVNMYNSNIATATNHITGSIDAKESGLLVCSIPYSTGWKSYVDGEQKKVYRTDYMYLSVPVTAGKHVIELRYETPLLKMSIGISVVSIFGFGVLVLCHKRKAKM